MSHFLVDILTPDKVVASGVPADSLIIPTVRGLINVLPNHTHIVTTLSTGQLSVFGGSDDPDRHFSVSHGICKVIENRITVLSNTCEEDADIDLERAIKALELAEEMLKTNDSMSDDEIEKFHRKVERAKLRKQMAEHKS